MGIKDKNRAERRLAEDRAALERVAHEDAVELARLRSALSAAEAAREEALRERDIAQERAALATVGLNRISDERASAEEHVSRLQGALAEYVAALDGSRTGSGWKVSARLDGAEQILRSLASAPPPAPAPDESGPTPEALDTGEDVARLINGLVEAGDLLMLHVQRIDFDPRAANMARECWLESRAGISGDDTPKYAASPPSPGTETPALTSGEKEPTR